MSSSTDNSSILIDSDIETVWNAITDPEKLLQWYAPGSPWKIPNLKVGEKVIFTLMPSAHNNLKDEYPMSSTIEKIIPYQEFSLYIDEQQILLSFTLNEEGTGIRVTINLEGFNQSLANLKALVEGKEIPYV
ncbi:SRPBCC family protein [Niallia endozanthoxylica]|uniref:SRPBCC domain-containing protein n=1 Tax=Niallia endozanthoxylica TaxID=2036016 RepID=A0A5J5H2S1_9BACI|nr:SRPBCC domain-containing protein [Niallia endozanthoxylica]KAA9014891.1 SRPBCC domain-containing protein [Niallia endozanthoxylica]